MIGLISFSILTTSISYAVNEPDRGTIIYVAKQLSGLDQNSTYFPTVLWDTLTNRAVIKTTELCSCVVAEDTVLTVSGTREYSLNTDFSNVLSVLRKTDPKHLKRIPYNQKGQIVYSDPSNPEFFYIKAQKIGLDRTPNKADTLFISYLKQAKLLTADATVTDIPSEYSNVIALFIASEALMRAKQFDQSAFFWQQAMSELELIRASKRFIPAESIKPKEIIPQ